MRNPSKSSFWFPALLLAAALAQPATAGHAVCLDVQDAGSGAPAPFAIDHVRGKVAGVLRTMGLEVRDAADVGCTRLTVAIGQLEYTRLMDSLAYTGIGTKVTLSVVASGQAGEYRHSYLAKTVHGTRIPPNAGNNEEWVQLAIGDVMPQLRGDAALRALLKG